MVLVKPKFRDIKAIVAAATVISLVACSGGGGGDESSAKTSSSTSVPVSSGTTVTSPSYEVDPVQVDDTDQIPTQLTFSYNETQITEGDTISVTASINKTLVSPLSFSIETNGTAELTSDYLLGTSNLSIPAGQTSVDFLVSLVDDAVIESVEILNITASNPSSAEIQVFSSSMLINDNDFAAPTDFSGMILHLSSSEGVSKDGSNNVLNWNDKTGSHAATPVSGGVEIENNSPHLGLPGIKFTDTNGFLTIANHIDLNEGSSYPEKTILMVFYTDSDVTSRQVIYEQGGSTRGLSLYIYEGLLYQCAWNNASEGGFSAWEPKCVTSPALKNSIHFTALRFDQPNNEIAAFVGFTKVDTLEAPGNIFGHAGLIGLGDAKDNSLYHDMQTSVNHPFKGYLYEYITYNNALSDTDIAGIYNALNPTYDFTSVKSYGLSSNVESISEGETIAFKIEASSPPATNITFNVSITGDFEEGELTFPSSVTIQAGTLETQFSVTSNTDSQYELLDIFNISISSEEGHDIHTPNNRFTVSDDTGTLLSDMTAWYKPEGLISASQWDNAINSKHQIKTFQASTAEISSIGVHNAIDFKGDGILTIDNHNDFNAKATTSKFFILAFETGSNTSTPEVIYEEGGGANGINLYVKDNLLTGSFWYKSGAVTKYDHAIAVDPNTRYVVLFYYDSVSDRFLMNVNRSLVGENSVGSMPLPAHVGKISLGAMYNDTYFDTAQGGNGFRFTGKIAEFMYFNNASKTDEQISTMVDYFNDKYGT